VSKYFLVSLCSETDYRNATVHKQTSSSEPFKTDLILSPLQPIMVSILCAHQHVSQEDALFFYNGAWSVIIRFRAHCKLAKKKSCGFYALSLNLYLRCSHAYVYVCVVHRKGTIQLFIYCRAVLLFAVICFISTLQRRGQLPGSLHASKELYDFALYLDAGKRLYIRKLPSPAVNKPIS